jgi:hypothetical protein
VSINPSPPNQLSSVNQQKIIDADRAAVEKALSQIAVSATADWLQGANPYAQDASKQLYTDGGTVPPAQAADFVQYLAASTFIHCGDAWGYWGKGLDALLRGDIATAIHLTYYAEMRAAISLLASEGIYIGNGTNLRVDSLGRIDSITKNRTHEAVWEYLSVWNSSTKGSALLGKVLRPGGANLDEWIQYMPSSGIHPVVAQLLDDISFDLKTFATDRERRNAASYNPSRIEPKDLDTISTCELIAESWLVLQPDTLGGFPEIDQALIGHILIDSYASLNQILDQNGNATGQVDWTNWSTWFPSTVPVQVTGSPLYNEMLSTPPKTPRNAMMGHLFTVGPPGAPPKDFISQMVARAIVLLRIATGSCLMLLTDSGVGRTAIEPWVNSLALSRGIWSSNDVPGNRIDLWQDCFDAQQLLSSSKHQESFQLFKSLGSDAIVLGQAERIIAWSFS